MIKIHFLNVDHGDCIIIENFDTGRNTIIDINRSKEFDETTSKELLEEFKINYCCDGVCAALESKGYNIKITDPVQYLKDNNILNIHRFVSTHSNAREKVLKEFNSRVVAKRYIDLYEEIMSDS